MIKTNVLRRNLLTNKVDFGDVIENIEFDNLNGNVNEEHPYVEISPSLLNPQSTDIEELKIIKIMQVKNIGATKILKPYPVHKQNNFFAQLDKMQYRKTTALENGEQYVLTPEDNKIIEQALACMNFIENIRKKSNEIEEVINNLSSIQEVLDFNINEVSLWG